MSAVEMFPTLLNDAEEESSAVPPCFSHEGINVRPTSNNRTPYGVADECVCLDGSTSISATATSISSH
jgi:hypothetical protein